MACTTLISAAIFALAMSITPGPNNALVMASAMNFGFVRTLPHQAGIQIGFALILFATALGLQATTSWAPWLSPVMSIAGAAIVLHFAWLLATSRDPSAVATAVRPWTMLEAAAFQWVNPKAWLMAMTAVGAYLPSDAEHQAPFTLTLVFALVGAPSVALWALAGSNVGRAARDARLLRMINIAMAAALALSIVPSVAAVLGLV